MESVEWIYCHTREKYLKLLAEAIQRKTSTYRDKCRRDVTLSAGVNLLIKGCLNKKYTSINRHTSKFATF